MSLTILPPLKFMLHLNEEMRELCLPLEKLGITFFNYLKIFKDGSRIDLNNHAGITKFYYYDSKTYVNQAVEWCPFSIMDKFLLWSNFNDPAWNVMRDEFNTTHGITLIKHANEYSELFHFSSTNENEKIISFYINNLDLLNYFIFYFRDKAYKIIQLAESKKIIPTDYQVIHPEDKNNNIGHNLEQKNIETFINELNNKRYYLDEDNYLTSMELNCIKWGLKGKSADEIGQILRISKRTCETHLNNVKEKLMCYKQLSLGYVLAKIFPDYLINR